MGTTPNLSIYDKDNKQQGLYVPIHPGGASNNITLVANRGWAMRFVPSRAMTIQSIAFSVFTAAGSNDNADVGIYDSALATKLVSSGATAGKLNATGVQSIAVTATTLSPGVVYYAAFSSGAIGTTAGAVAGASIGSGAVASLFGATAGLIDIALNNAAHPLGATFAPSLAGNYPILALREF